MTRMHAAGPRGFSLIEILVVILLIALLIGIIGAVFASMRTSALQRSASGAMQQLLNASESYRLQTGRDIRNDNRPGMDSIESFVDQAMQLPEVEAVLVTLGDNILLVNPDPPGVNPDFRPIVLDPWGTPYIYRNPEDDEVPPDIQSVLDQDPDALQSHRRPYFISAGPSRSFTGDDARDNLYSFNLD